MLKITFCSCNAHPPEVSRAVCDQLIEADVLLQTLRVLAEDEALNTIKGSLLRLVSDQLDQGIHPVITAFFEGFSGVLSICSTSSRIFVGFLLIAGLDHAISRRYEMYLA
jgi:hypothetical protein